MEEKVFVGREVQTLSSLPNHQTHGHLELRKLTALPWELGLLPKEQFLNEPEETSSLFCSLGKRGSLGHRSFSSSQSHARRPEHAGQTQNCTLVMQKFKHSSMNKTCMML